MTNSTQRALQSTHTTSLTFDLTSDQEQLPRKLFLNYDGVLSAVCVGDIVKKFHDLLKIMILIYGPNNVITCLSGSQ